MKKVILSLSLVVFLLAGFTTVSKANNVTKAAKVTVIMVSADYSTSVNPLQNDQDQPKKKEDAAKSDTKTKTDGCAKTCDKAAKSCCDKGVKTSCDKSKPASCDKSKADAAKTTNKEVKAEGEKK